MFEIRKAVLADAGRIAQIHAETWLAAYHDFIPADFLDNKAKLEPRRKMWNDFLSQEQNSHYVAVKDETIVGFFSIDQPRDADLPQNICELVGIYFDSAYWHMGFGTLAIQFIIEQANRRGCKGVSLWVFQQNHSAISFYEKFGFCFDGTTNVLMLGDPVTECRYGLEFTNE